MMTRNMYMIVLISTVILTGCGNFQKNQIEPTIEGVKEESITMPESSTVILEESSENLDESKTYIYETQYRDNVEGMALYSSYPFVYNDSEWELQKYIQDDMYIDGELYLDDNAHFIIQAISKEKAYILFDENVQLGEPSADIWIDLNDRLHVVINDVRTARYRLIDFVYELNNLEVNDDYRSGVFAGTNIITADGINYLGSLK